jgi:hypothetical protein
MGIVQLEYLDSDYENKRIYACLECKTHLSSFDRIISTVSLTHSTPKLIDQFTESP